MKNNQESLPTFIFIKIVKARCIKIQHKTFLFKIGCGILVRLNIIYSNYNKSILQTILKCLT